MCGIVGFINGENTAKFGSTCQGLFEQLLWHSTQRGPDGTGVVSINNGKDGLESTMYKNAMWAPEYLGYISYKNIIQKRLEWARAAIGHNRATTRGSVKNDNAHPFVHKHITLVQNGVIQNPGSHLPKGLSHDVDSYTAAYLMAEKGEKEALEMMDFGGVFVWWNDQDKTLNMARNKHRELWCATIKDHNALFYASEWQMLHWILSRNGLETDGKYKLLTPMVQFKFDVTKPKEWTRIPFVEPPSPKQNQSHHSRWSQAAVGGATGTQIGTANTNTSKDQTSTYTPGSKEHDTVLPKRADQFTESEIEYIERSMARLTAKERKKFGIPESRHKLRKVCAKIHNTGMGSHFGQRFIVYPDSWAPYKNQTKLGVIIGSKRSNAEIHIEIPNVSSVDFDRIKQDKWAFATVINAKKSKTGKFNLVCALIDDFTKPKPSGDVTSGVKAHTNADGTRTEIVKGPRGSYIDLHRFQALTQTGCGNCGGWINPNHADEIVWFADEPICHICCADAQIMAQLGLTPSKALAH